MRNENLGYTINWMTNTVTMTKAFAKKAGQKGTPEYEILLDARRNGFYLAERPRQQRKACPTRISFAKMENYLSCLDHPDQRIEEFHDVMIRGKSTPNQYEFVRKWFLENYRDFDKIPEHNEDYSSTSSQEKIASISDAA